MIRVVYGFILLFMAIFMTFGFYAKAEDMNYKDGIYIGEYSFVKVRVVVEEGKISDIEMLHHGGGGKKYENMAKDLIPSIIEKQSIEVDAITGATVSSENLKKAIENALQSQN